MPDNKKATLCRISNVISRVRKPAGCDLNSRRAICFLFSSLVACSRSNLEDSMIHCQEIMICFVFLTLCLRYAIDRSDFAVEQSNICCVHVIVLHGFMDFYQVNCQRMGFAGSPGSHIWNRSDKCDKSYHHSSILYVATDEETTTFHHDEDRFHITFSLSSSSSLTVKRLLKVLPRDY